MAAATAAITEKFVGRSASDPPAASATAAVTSANHCSGNTHNGLGCQGQEVIAGAEDHQHKFPIWVGLNCKLVGGISKSTTCHDLISSIVPSSQDPSKYVLVEKWKKMERILDPSVKILKVWKAWGDQVGDVSFVLRSSPTADGYIDKKTSRKVHRKRSSSYHHQKIACHDDDCDKEGHRDAMEQLIKLVITQGEAIQAQLKKLRHQEEQIDRYEEKMHKIRSSQHGENYVVDTYLQDEAKPARRIKHREKSPSKRNHHGNHHHHHHHHHHHYHRQKKGEQPEQDMNLVDEEATPADAEYSQQSSTNLPVNSVPLGAPQDSSDPVDSEEASGEPAEVIKEKTEIMESIFQLNVRLTQEEERLVKLGLKIRKLSDKQRKAEWEELALQDITQELEHLKQVTNDQSKEIEVNERNLTALEQFLDNKHDHIAFLTHEIQLVDEESEMLQREVLEMTTHLSSCRQQQQQHSCHPEQQVYHLPKPVTPAHHPHHPANTMITPADADVTRMECHPQQQYFKAAPSLDKPVQVQKTRGSSKSRESISKIQESSVPSASSARYQCQQQSSQQLDTCSSSCSNSSSVCVNQTKQCSAGDGGGGSTASSTDPQDNDSNSDTGISSLHSSVDESPMYVLDTLV